MTFEEMVRKMKEYEADRNKVELRNEIGDLHNEISDAWYNQFPMWSIDDVLRLVAEPTRVRVRLEMNGDTDTFLPASEVSAAFMSAVDAYEDRKTFVHNLGVLLHQTREGIGRLTLDNCETVTVHYKGGDEETINVNMDSYMAIVRDIAKYI